VPGPTVTSQSSNFALIQDRVVPDFLHEPALPPAPDLHAVAPSLLADSPDLLLALASDLLIWGDAARGGECLDLLERAQPPVPPGSALAGRLAAMRSFRHGQFGRLDEAIAEALAARAVQEQTPAQDEWATVVPLILLRVYNCLEDGPAIEREAAAALAMPALTRSRPR
jgi:LuxR family transcriptional regulator, maltose regulon positive regulatory protein